ncbi:MAG: SH3 domain-containing protein [Anaerolineales bacterium]|jgi:hypothetical protein|uniref:SH3 domain-containing protein n=1 Tax=Candidatus Villigracilis vicinus TaxID=3140679 RepID=UPI0031371324|nr:SH3 domain-containing protein [Anaerolineales bacterium]MBK7449114.1 SH3 domain-containing protein [Anaerolineales bacterium]
MRTSWKNLLGLVLLCLTACGGETTGYTSVNAGNEKVKVSASINTNGEIQVSGAYVIKEFNAGKLGRVSWEVGIAHTWDLAKSKSNTLFILYEDDGEIIQKEYYIGQPFLVTFAYDQWVRSVEDDGNGNIVITVERRVAPISPAAADPKPTSKPQSNSGYWCDDLSLLRLEVGDTASISYPKVNLRSTPKVPDDYYANIVTELENGVALTITGGPECAHEGTWWEVRTEYGDTGWVREHTKDGYLMKP